MTAEPAPPDPGAPRDLVLDTNVVLDWLVFAHPVAAFARGGAGRRSFRWLCTAAMRDEFQRVVGRAALAHRVGDAGALLAAFDAHAVHVDEPPPLGASERLRCTDPDDQIFIDLAIARRVHALLTRDRAVLRLAARSRRFGVLFATPERWLQGRRRDPGGDGSARLSVACGWCPIAHASPTRAAQQCVRVGRTEPACAVRRSRARGGPGGPHCRGRQPGLEAPAAAAGAAARLRGGQADPVRHRRARTGRIVRLAASERRGA